MVKQPASSILLPLHFFGQSTSTPKFLMDPDWQWQTTLHHQHPPATLNATPSKFNSELKPLKNGWLDDDPFLLGLGNFSGARC